jgi:hypothetical protein
VRQGDAHILFQSHYFILKYFMYIYGSKSAYCLYVGRIDNDRRLCNLLNQMNIDRSIHLIIFILFF